MIRLNQRVIDPLIIDDYPGALTLDYLLRGLEWYINAEEFADVKIFDLTGTYLTNEDFLILADHLLPNLPLLEIIILTTVQVDSLDQISRLFNRSIRYIVVTGAYTQTRAELFEFLQDKDELQEKLIFLHESYYQRCKYPYGRDKFLKTHSEYYQHLRTIANVRTIHFLTGDTDEDRRYFLTDDN